MLEVYQIAKAFGEGPRRIVGIDDSWLGFQFDLAVLQIGSEFEKNLQDGMSPREALTGEIAFNPADFPGIKTFGG
jgi:hypothetical protein